jgi:hypothetical protein
VNNKTDVYNLNTQTMPEITQEEMNGVKALFSNDDDFLFVSTLGIFVIKIDGHIHAYDSSNEKLWSVYLGKPLITSTVNSQSVIQENSIIPGLDGNLYLYNQESDKPVEVKFNNSRN